MLEQLAAASLPIKIHIAAILPSTFLGTYILISKKGTPVHKLLGRIWLCLMVIASVSSFFIHTIGGIGDFSPIHALSVWVLIAAYIAIWSARTKRFNTHRKYMAGTYLGSIVLTGFFTFSPERLMNKLILDGYSFSSTPNLKVLITGTVLVAMFVFAGLVGVKVYRGK